MKYLIVLAAVLFSCHDPHPTLHMPGTANAHHYTWVNSWPGSLEHLGDPSGIAVDTAGNIVVFHRGTKKWPLLLPFSKAIIPENTILVLDRNTGQIKNSWGGGIFIMPHSLTTDRENNIWVTDVGLHQVLKFTPEGRLLLRVGEAGIPGNDSAHFARPTDIAVSPDGSFYVADGYINSRIVKFSATGQFQFAWGRKGHKPGQFNLPHGITLDERGNVYVADRENSRIQVFDPNGKFKREWKDRSFGKMYAIRYDQQRKEFVAADYITNYITPKGSDCIIFDQDGNIKTRFGRSGNYDGPVCRYHDLAIDKDGNLYVGDILQDRIQKFERAPKATPRLVTHPSNTTFYLPSPATTQKAPRLPPPADAQTGFCGPHPPTRSPGR